MCVGMNNSGPTEGARPLHRRDDEQSRDLRDRISKLIDDHLVKGYLVEGYAEFLEKLGDDIEARLECLRDEALVEECEQKRGWR
jgi:hypothetical protein